MSVDCHKLILNSKAFKIPLVFKNIINISPEISNKLIINSDHQYTIKSNVSEEVLQSFINYLVNDEIPDIQIENYNEFFQLSDEFKILHDVLESKKEEFGDILINLNGIQNINDSNLSSYEEQISINLDEYITKYGNILIKSPIHSLYNIFNHEKCALTKHDLAYKLIKDHYECTNDSSIFVLLQSLDGAKMSRSNIEECLKLRAERSDFVPKLDFSCFSLLGKGQSESSHDKKHEEALNCLAESVKKMESVILSQSEKISSLEADLIAANKKLSTCEQMNEELKNKRTSSGAPNGHDISSLRVGDILTTVRNLDDDDNWLECTGGDISEEEYPELHAVLPSAPIGNEWHAKETGGTWRGYSYTATDGEYFVVAQKVSNNIQGNFKYTFVVYYTKNPSGTWNSTSVELDGVNCSYMESGIGYANGEFYTFYSERVSSFSPIFCIYALHAKTPEGPWERSLVYQFNLTNHSSSYISLAFDYFINNTYVLWFRSSSCISDRSCNQHAGFLYGTSFSKTFSCNSNFSPELSSSQDTYFSDGRVAYGDNKYAVFTKKSISYKTSSTSTTSYWVNVYYAGDLATLSKNSPCVTLHSYTYQQNYNDINPSDMIYRGGYWVALADLRTFPYSALIFYTKNIEANFTKVTFNGTEAFHQNNLVFLDNKFFFGAQESNTSHANIHQFIFYTTGSTPDKWEKVVVFDRPYTHSFRLSADEKNRTILGGFTSDFPNQAKKSIAVWTTLSSKYRTLPKITPGLGLKAYIKAKDDANNAKKSII